MGRTDPTTGQPLASRELIPNVTFRRAIEELLGQGPPPPPWPPGPSPSSTPPSPPPPPPSLKTQGGGGAMPADPAHAPRRRLRLQGGSRMAPTQAPQAGVGDWAITNPKPPPVPLGLKPLSAACKTGPSGRDIRHPSWSSSETDHHHDLHHRHHHPSSHRGPAGVWKVHPPRGVRFDRFRFH